jgi:hypothetical protein
MIGGFRKSYWKPKGQQQFELAVSQNTMVTGISQPIEISAVKL